MSVGVTAAAAVGVCTAVVFLLLFRKLVSAERLAGFAPDWLSRFSVDKYRPMERLLSESDYEFLSTQRGYEPRIARKLRSERRKIFREYLRCMKRDFNRLDAAARLLMVGSAVDRPDLAKALMMRRLTFTYALLLVQCRLVLHTVGIGTVDVSGLVASMDSMRVQLGELAWARGASIA